VRGCPGARQLRHSSATLRTIRTTRCCADRLNPPLPNAAELTADLHSLLVYEPSQFFLAHQDSEKDDSMIGTLVGDAAV
jgi:hypothetical protein